MRKVLSIVRATALEILSEPLTLLVTLVALALAVLAPAFHCHQFGEATRMARDAGFSAVLAAGVVLAVFGTIRAVRREVESGTLEMALSRPVSRSAYFLSRTLGAFVAVAGVAVIVFATALAVIEGAAAGGRLAERTGDLARIWGPCVAAGVAVLLLPLVLSAALNRFARMRFVLSAMVLSMLLSCGCGAWALLRDPAVLAPCLTALLPLLTLLAVFVAAAAALAFRFRANGAAAGTGLLAAGALPFVGNYYLSDALANGGRVAWSYVGLAVLAAVPALAAFLILGCRFCGETSGREGRS